MFTNEDRETMNFLSGLGVLEDFAETVARVNASKTKNYRQGVNHFVEDDAAEACEGLVSIGLARYDSRFAESKYAREFIEAF